MTGLNRYPLLGLQRGMVLVPARLYGTDGSVDFSMALDTGASITVVTPRIAQIAGLDIEAAREESVTYTWDGPVLGLNFLRHFDLRLNFREEYIELR